MSDFKVNIVSEKNKLANYLLFVVGRFVDRSLKKDEYFDLLNEKEAGLINRLIDSRVSDMIFFEDRKKFVDFFGANFWKY